MNEKLRQALQAVRDELAALVKDEACDHAVGICWCATFRALEQADEALLEARMARSRLS